MKKVARYIMKREIFFEYGSAAGQYMHVERFGNSYCIRRDTDGEIFAIGKELKGFLGDIIYPQYDGERYGTGNYYLNSNRHGIICKWKPNEE